MPSLCTVGYLMNVQGQSLYIAIAIAIVMSYGCKQSMLAKHCLRIH
jgi:hypothetical protein